jgi:hypothetical protein
MIETGCPKCLWDDCLELQVDINSFCVHDNHDLDGETPQAIITGETPDISLLAEFKFYQWVKWFDKNADLPDDQEVCGRYLGPSRDVRSMMTAKILKKNGGTIHQSTFCVLMQSEIDSPTEALKCKEFDDQISTVLGDKMNEEDIPEDETPEYECYEDDMTKPVEPVDRDDIDQHAIDMFLKPEVVLPISGEMLTRKVEWRKRDTDGNLIGKKNSNPILDTREYVVKFPDGREAVYSTSVIAGNMLSMCDEEGNQFLLLKHIIDHKKDETALKQKDA